MAVEVTAYIWKHSKQKGSARLMLLAIADSANKDGFAYPAVETLAEMTGTTIRSAQRTLDNLEADQSILIYNRTDPDNGARHFSNVYKIPMPGNEEAPPPPIFGQLKLRIITKPNDAHVTRVMTPTSLPNDAHVTRVMTPTSLNPLVVPSFVPSVVPNPLPPAKPVPKPQNLIFDATSWAWKNTNGNYVGKLVKFLTGKCTAKDGLYYQFQPDSPLTPLEVVGYRLWREYLDLDITNIMPSKPETINRTIEEFRGVEEYSRILQRASEILPTLGRENAAQSPPDEPVPTPVPEALQHYDTEAALDALVKKVEGHYA